MPQVTVIIPTYNWSSVLPYSIGSALRQTFAGFELLVDGDGCTDDSEEVVGRIGDPRVRWINLPENTRHQSGPNNEGLRQARGEIIAYLGHDDLWFPHHLEAHLAAYDSEGADVTYPILGLVQPDGIVTPWTALPKYGSFTPPSSLTHRKTMTDELGPWRHYSETSVTPDAELVGRAWRAGRKFTFVPRLTAIKFAASARPGVYETKPCHEQAEWFDRIGSDPALEARLLATFVADGRVATGFAYRDLARHFFIRTLNKLPEWFSISRLTSRFEKPKTIDDWRRLKGL